MAATQVYDSVTKNVPERPSSPMLSPVLSVHNATTVSSVARPTALLTGAPGMVGVPYRC
ncbi:MAG: hypothetical protein M1399_08275 [Actinobacteria bacterium]|nr:hypothetical protein [Actinomycetota bacterium]